MHVETRGPEDAPALVCLHGGTGTGAYHWGRAARALEERYRVHLADLPGHGGTPLPEDGRYDRTVLVEATRALLERVGRPAHVLAFSLGGHVSLRLAVEDPDAFASLTLVGVSVRPHAGLQGWRANFVPDVLEAKHPLWAKTLSRIHEPLGGPDAWRDVCHRDTSDLRLWLEVDRLADLACPVLLVRGDRDPAIEPAQYGELRELWGAQAEELVVPRGGHDVQMTRTALVTPGLADFLDRVTG
jgi:3-oxoadipate enol-lactonase